MITSSDKEYIETKLIKQGKLKLKQPFTDLAEWIYSEYKCRPINIVYDILSHNNRPRLQVIFEKFEEKITFSGENGLFPNKSRQESIAKKFALLSKCFPEFSNDKLFVVFSSFNNIAKEEANKNIPQKCIDNLKSKINLDGFWEIKRNFYTGIFFFHKQTQADKFESDDTMEVLKNLYFDLIKEYDEFNYINKNEFEIKIDSKENFDNNYASNWFYYFKGN